MAMLYCFKPDMGLGGVTTLEQAFFVGADAPPKKNSLPAQLNFYRWFF